MPQLLCLALAATCDKLRPIDDRSLASGNFTVMPHPFHVVIASAGHPELVSRTLQSLAQCELPAGYARTIIVENGKPAGIRQAVEAAPAKLRATYLYSPIANKANALNVGLASIERGLVLFSDDDISFSPSILTRYQAAASQDNHRNCFFGGPLEIDSEAGEIPQQLLPMLPRSVNGVRLAYEVPTKLKKYFFLGANWAAFAEDCRDLGGFDSRFGPGAATGSGGDETDLQRRLMAAGKRPCYVPGASVWHWVRSCMLSEEWIIKRGFQHGVEWGICRGLSCRSRPLKRIALQCVAMIDHVRCQVMLWQNSPLSQLQARYRLSMWEGRRKGLAIAADWNNFERLPFPAGETSNATTAGDTKVA